MGKWKAERFLVFDGRLEEDARDKFTRPLLKRYTVPESDFSRPETRPSLGGSINPDGKKLSDENWDILAFVFADHNDHIRDLITSNGLFEAQLEARKDAVRRGAYEAVPGLTYGSLEACDSRPESQMAVHVMYVIDNWAVNLVIMKGEYPELDNKYAELQSAIDVRNLELRNYIDSF